MALEAKYGIRVRLSQGEPHLKEAMVVLKNAEDRWQQIVDLLTDLRLLYEKQHENAELENVVLTKLNQKLG